MDDWITHIAKNEATYRNMQHFNPMFALQLACFIDRKVQLYLRGCSEAQSPDDVPSTILSFSRAKTDIMEGSFTNNLIPRTLSDQLRKKCYKTGPLIAGDSSSDNEPAPRNRKHQQQKQGKGCKVVNDNPVRKWLVNQPALDSLSSNLSRTAHSGVTVASVSITTALANALMTATSVTPTENSRRRSQRRMHRGSREQ
jgi:hypothetical protein